MIIRVPPFRRVARGSLSDWAPRTTRPGRLAHGLCFGVGMSAFGGKAGVTRKCRYVVS